MTRVLRWSCEIDDHDHELPVPPGDVVRVGGESVYGVEFWTLGQLDAAPAPRVFRVFGTGQPVPVGYVHRGTTERTGHGLVWHLFERAEPDHLRVDVEIVGAHGSELVDLIRKAIRFRPHGGDPVAEDRGRLALCGARGLAIAAEGAPVQVPRCGKPLGHVEAGDRWHTPDVDDWGPDMRWSAAAGVLRTPAGLTPEQAASIRRVFEAQYPPRPDDLPPDRT